MLLKQIRDEANLVNELLSRRAYTRKRRERRRPLQEAIDASLRALPVLAEEPLIVHTEEYLNDSFERLGGNRLGAWTISFDTVRSPIARRTLSDAPASSRHPSSVASSKGRDR